jgi:Chaperone of endosialidase
MNRLIHFKTTTLPLLIAPLLVWFELASRTQATDLGSVLPNHNTADGSGVLTSLTTGQNNSGFGFQALNHNMIGNGNTATGYQALYNDSGNANTAIGTQALFNNTIGINNVAAGWQALLNNKAGNNNLAVGQRALASNDFGEFNSALGQGALEANTLGNNNTASGAGALSANFIGVNNTATGFQALNDNVGGFQNTAIGSQALPHSTGYGNIGVGYLAGRYVTTGNNNIDIGNQGGTGESGTIRIGTEGVHFTTYIAGILGATTEFNNAVPVLIDSLGQLGTTSSSRRFKKEIKPMDKASEDVLALKPVTFHYKSDPKNRPQYGLVAEEVAEVNPDLVVRDKNGEIYTVRYDTVNAMLLNEFLKEHRRVRELTNEVAALTATVKEQSAQIQKVSAQLEVSKPLQTVANNQ